MLGYFSIIGLFQVRVHRGDFTLGFKVTENVELNQQVSPDDTQVNLPAVAFYSLPCAYYVVSTISCSDIIGIPLAPS